jgi:hypothetical protein
MGWYVAQRSLAKQITSYFQWTRRNDQSLDNTRKRSRATDLKYQDSMHTLKNSILETAQKGKLISLRSATMEENRIII